jgi:hypothetical protein
MSSEPPPFWLSHDGSGRATAYLESGKIVTHDGRSHVVWLDSIAEGFRVRARTYDHTPGTWGPVVTIGEAYDNHGGPALTVDDAGYLHVVFYAHHHPLRYRRSVRPGDITAWTDEEHVGTDLTYPNLLVAPDGTLLLAARRSYEHDPRSWELERWTRAPGGAWQRHDPILRARWGRYTQFAASLAWGPARRRLWLACRYYDMPAHPDPRAITQVNLIYSDDLGETWFTPTGRAVTTPLAADGIEGIDQADTAAESGLDGGSLGVDARGQPWLAYSRNQGAGSEAWLVTPAEGGAWRRVRLNDWLPEAVRDWPMMHQGGVTFASTGRMVVVSRVVPPGAVAKHWGHPGSELVVFSSLDGGTTFTGRLLLAPDAGAARWLPSLEQPTGANIIPPHPGLLFTEGPAGATLFDQLANQVGWVGLRD